MQIGIQVCKEGVAQSTCCSCTRAECQFGSSTSRLFGRLCESAQPPVKCLYLLGRGTLLRGKDIGGSVLAEQGIVDITSCNHLAIHIETTAVFQSLNHATSAITCCATANTHHYLTATSLHGVGYHFAHTISCGFERVASFRGHERKSACCRHFHIGGLAVCRNSVFSLYHIH